MLNQKPRNGRRGGHRKIRRAAPGRERLAHEIEDAAGPFDPRAIESGMIDKLRIASGVVTLERREIRCGAAVQSLETLPVALPHAPEQPITRLVTHPIAAATVADDEVKLGKPSERSGRVREGAACKRGEKAGIEAMRDGGGEQGGTKRV